MRVRDEETEKESETETVVKWASLLCMRGRLDLDFSSLDS